MRKKTKKDELKPMGVIQIGKHLPFNEMGAKQNINIYHLTTTTR